MGSMLYVKLDTSYHEDEKIIMAGEDAELLFIRSLCLVKRILSDGFVSDAHLPRFGLTDVQTRADQLVKVGLWERDDEAGGYWIPSWLEHNKSAREVEEIREARRRAGRKGGKASGRSRRKAKREAPSEAASEADGEASASTGAEATVKQTTNPEAEAEAEAEAEGDTHAPAHEAHPNGTPRWDTDWRKVHRELRRGSNRPTPDHLPDRAQRAIRHAGGMRTLGELDETSAKFTFRDAWQEVGP